MISHQVRTALLAATLLTPAFAAESMAAEAKPVSTVLAVLNLADGSTLEFQEEAAGGLAVTAQGRVRQQNGQHHNSINGISIAKLLRLSPAELYQAVTGGSAGRLGCAGWQGSSLTWTWTFCWPSQGNTLSTFSAYLIRSATAVDWLTKVLMPTTRPQVSISGPPHRAGASALRQTVALPAAPSGAHTMRQRPTTSPGALKLPAGRELTARLSCRPAPAKTARVPPASCALKTRF